MNKKTLIIMLCAVLTLGSVAMGTIAFLTDRTSLANTFTVGNVQIELDEAKVNEYGQTLDKDGNVTDVKEDVERVGGTDDPANVSTNEYRLVPGMEYTKDPTMTVLEDSEECYVRMKVIVHDAADFNVLAKYLNDNYGDMYTNGNLLDFLGEYDAEKWPLYTQQAGDNGTDVYEFRYVTPVPSNTEDSTELAPLFKKFVLPGELDGEQLATLDQFKLIVEGNAIQTAVFKDKTNPDDPDDIMYPIDQAWAAFDKQMNPATEEDTTEEDTTEEDTTDPDVDQGADED